MSKAYQKLIVVLFILSCFTAFSQTEKTQQQKNDEYGMALKKWCDSAEIIIDCDLAEENIMFIDTGGINPKNGFKYGYDCTKIKINRILKGELQAGYININPNYFKDDYTRYLLTEGGTRDNSKFILTGRNLVSIKKGKITKEGFTTENSGVYETVGTVYHLDTPNYEVRKRKVNGKDEFYNTTKLFYDKLKNCGCVK
jgi:hypothetical protein